MTDYEQPAHGQAGEQPEWHQQHESVGCEDPCDHQAVDQQVAAQVDETLPGGVPVALGRNHLEHGLERSGSGRGGGRDGQMGLAVEKGGGVGGAAP